MTTPDDRRDDLVEELRQQLRLYTLPPNVATYLAPADNHDSVSRRCSEAMADALVPLLEDWLDEAEGRAAAAGFADGVKVGKSEAWVEGVRFGLNPYRTDT